MSFFEPSPVLLAFIFVQRFVFFEVLGLLAVLRMIAGRGMARVPAAIALIISSAAIFASFAPALNLQSLPLYADIARVQASGGGMILPLVASAIFALSLVLPQRRWRWIDVLHIVGVLAFLGLWLATRV
ncbi:MULTISPECIES: hypothetical protein [Marivita]|uniref:Uncharacterized protein n=1 Tax=Marivita cryptomonadis TaxID=505252 RepID=A0A9Q2P5Q9_9RHOB|nr:MULTISPECIES: hypothetical protein [Marivita]MCR9167857.1 hypothetical protein [Paracoccaceae bacterium]MBM2322770.1 hypothetical protein [Marivita cryptomonadis]MBM2332352.1 hypothetical protein [Marivita cryptomonadis]MBM2341936.1 hypothetical protein [Marivita cryptomonadis]MBM2346600.1 hypothetical protein [Marivita cryptomonadis]